MTRNLPNWRSLLYVPASEERFVAKAHERGADAIILDLEDGVAPDSKARARAGLAASAASARRNGADIVVRINRERGTTILLVEQNANMALNAADRGYVLENGRIVMQDTCERLREKEDIREFYLGIKEDGVRTERRWKKKKTWR
jgi:ABC-type cobalamin transport system ATPase subunit